MIRTITYDDTLYQLVPKEPTDEMVEAAWESDAADYVGEHKRIWQAGLAYIAMLSAAPTPPAQTEAATPAAGGGDAVAIIRRQPNGVIAMWRPDGGPFDISGYVGSSLYTHPQPSALPDEVVKDAERYRYARENPSVMYERWEPIALSPEEIDAAIDAAMLKEGK